MVSNSTCCTLQLSVPYVHVYAPHIYHLLFIVGNQAGQAFFDPNNPQNVYVPQHPTFGGGPSQPPGYPNANNSAPPPPGFIPQNYQNGSEPSAPPFQSPGYPTAPQNGYPTGPQNGYPTGPQNGYPTGPQNGYPPEGPPPPYSEKTKKMQ